MEWKPNSKPQVAFFESNADEILYGGAAGGGKSECLLAEATRDMDKPLFRALLLRRTFPELKSTLIDLSHTWFKNKAGWNGSDKTWTFNSGAKIRFGHLERDEDVYKYDSAEFDYIAFDELTSFNEFQYTYMRSRNRGKDPRIFKRMRAGSNPGKVGHAWVKRRFPIKEPYKLIDVKEGNAVVKVQFIPSLPTDNPDLMRNNPGYLNKLESLPEPYRSALLLGDWDINVGTFFEEFGAKHRLIDSPNLQSADGIFVSMDWGYNAPAAIHWHAIFKMDGFNRIITYRELYGSGKKASERAEQINEFKEPTIAKIADPSAFNKLAGEDSVIAIMEGKGCRGWKPGNNDRLNGWMVMKEWLSTAPDGKPFWQIHESCQNLIRTIPEMVKSDNNPEDIDTDGEDHAVDGCRYFLMSQPRPRRVAPKEIIVPERSLQHFKNLRDQRNKSQGVGSYAIKQ
jgi:hypothetical protein